ncbi:MAG: diguanylate cyclase [Peptococcaceae bacterium]|nr:diguanylate cyclase [Peptococcaceae bacterium]
MRILVASCDDTLAEYLRNAGHETKTLYANDMAVHLASEFNPDKVVYQTNVNSMQSHEDTILALKNAGFHVVLCAEPGDYLIPYAAALGIADIITLPADPANVLFRIENPATHQEVAELVRKVKSSGEAKIANKNNRKKKVWERFRSRWPNWEKAKAVSCDTSDCKFFKKTCASILVNGRVSEVSPGEVLDAIDPDTEAVFIPPDLDLLQEIRRNQKALAVPVFVVSRYDRRFIEAGADDCVETMDASAIERARAQSEKMKTLWEKANRDSLTGCYTRAFLDAWLEEKEAEYKKTGVPFTVMIADLDQFKQINDTYGHQAGDAVLAEFGMFLRESVRQVDVVARYGGEEFVVVFPCLDDAGAIAEKLCRGWAELEISLPGGEKIHSTFSAGLAVMGRDAGDVDALLGAADRALYRAKESGRNLVIAGDNISSERDEVFKESPPFKKKSVEFEKKIRAPADIEYAIDEIKRHAVIVVWNLDGWGKAESAIEIAVKIQKIKRRVLLAEMDFLNPAIDRIVGIPIVKKKDIPGKSVTEIGAGLLTLGAQLEPEHAVGLIRQKHGSLKVDYLAAGNDLGVTGEYASEQVYHDMVALLAKQYDHVVIDLGVNTDNQVFRGVVKRADILVIPASNNTVTYTRYEKIVSVKEAIFVKRS